MADIVLVLGTRPEIIKLAPVIRHCERQSLDYSVIHTGQHYSENLDTVFFEQLDLPEPEYNLRVGSKSHGKQTGEMIIGIEEILLEEEPEVVLVQGDTNSVLAGAIATSKLNIELGHVEAGLRSFDDSMPEETNRILTDHTSDYLFAPTEQSREYLLDEGIDESKVFVTGNTVVDAVQENAAIATDKTTILADYGLEVDEFVLMTAHRAENVDDRDRFANILRGAGQVATELGLSVIYPIHPRARQKLEEFDLVVPASVTLIEPQAYLDFLTLQSEAALILTDSGGVQEEACVLGTPCVTFRDNTERPETVDVGANRLVSADADSIVSSAVAAVDESGTWENPFGDGTAAEQILQAIIHPSKPEMIP
ncbi:non-hydrolyzing UDP-N-acetylglucosamine 2-epimerase [Haloferacaceae archaeon DSL9]